MTSWSFKTPEFHGDPSRYPQESWEDYEESLELAYESSGQKNVDDDMKRGRLLNGLQGKAKSIRQNNKHWKKTPYRELLQILRRKFGKSTFRNLEEIGRSVQKSDETVAEFLARMRTAFTETEALTEEYAVFTVETKTEKKELEADAKDAGGEVVPQEVIEQENQLRSDMIDRLILPHFINGLRKDIRQTIMQAGPRTLKEAFAKAENYERYTEIFQGTENYMANLSREEPVSEKRV